MFSIAMLGDFRDATDGSAWKSRELTMLLVEQTNDPFGRTQFAPGHVTCTGLVLAPDLTAVLFVHHARLDRWLLPGGHIEPGDLSAFEAARREVIEETAAVLDAGVEPFLAGLDVHGIPARREEPYHLHHDLIVAFRARSRDVVRSGESHDIAWLEPAQFDAHGVPESIRRSVTRALARLQPLC